MLEAPCVISLSQALYKLDLVEHACNSSFQEVDGGRTEIQIRNLQVFSVR